MDKAQFDMAFLDVRLGDEDGLDLLPDLLRGNANLNVVVFTAYASIESAVEAMRRGAGLSLKPFTPDQVRQVLRKVSKQRQLEGGGQSGIRLSSDTRPPASKR